VFAVLNASKPPVIAVTTYRQPAASGVWNVEAAFLPAMYFSSVTDTGAVAVLLPPQPATPGAAERVLDGVDGLIVAGGRDVNPARYGQEPSEHTDQPDLLRDEWETALLESALARDLPTLAICRGLQVLNVLKGGTLHQHLPDVVGHNNYQVGGGQFTEMTFDVTPGSALSTALDGDTAVTGQVYHHQAIDRVGDGLSVSARTAEGVIEAVDIDELTFGIGVQWHPEVTSANDGRLFRALTNAATTYRRNA
jgi:putative glutamine amidotransferase